MKTRVQLSLYVPTSSAEILEATRRLLDPIQCSLIPAHVTLCREEDLQDLNLANLVSIIASSGAGPMSLKFGSPQVFQEHGVLLPCIEGEEEFQELRCRLLGSRSVRRQAPHITLAHPRNSCSPHNKPSNLGAVPSGLVITFSEVRYIMQEAAMPWQVIATYPLLGGAHIDA